ncbi:MAG TPA: hypothetical protein VG538_10620 [Vicinamibacterales bacterium]|nr:hypothetical protein [Vicinamibacterales bacterium]
MGPWPRLTVHQQRRVIRLRRIGASLLAACIALAMIVYRVGLAHRAPTAAELLPGTAAVIERQRGILFGRSGAAMFELFETLQEPEGQAGILVLVGIIAAAACYQVAHKIEIGED